MEVCQKIKYRFDFGIYDEAHRSVGEEDKRFTVLLSSNIEDKRLFMTATEKIYNYNKSKKSDDEKEKVLSMDNESVYGKVIYKYSMRQAIEEDVLVNYRLVAPFMNTNEYDEDLLNNKFVKHKEGEIIRYDIRTILTSLMIVLNMKKYKFKHLLIFSNTNERAKKLIEFIQMYLDETDPDHNINCKYLSGNDNMNKRKYEVKDFENSEYGIISSARIFGEGVDIKICDAVCFADGKSSSVDIVQYTGRCLRKYELLPDKISHILIPFVMDNETEFFDYENQSYIKLRKILKTIGTTDEMVTEKFIIVDCNEKKQDKNTDKNNKSESYKAENESKFDMEEFRKKLMSKIFDRTGDEIDMTRNKVIFENAKRYKNGEELIDTRKKCIHFLQNNGINEPQNIKNWIRYSFGEIIFEKEKKKYYYTNNEIINECSKLKITDFESYKKKFSKDIKLPNPNYINDGFYYDMDPKFNIEILLSGSQQDDDF